MLEFLCLVDPFFFYFCKMKKKEISEIKIGILGGGQLGRMMIPSAISYDLDISILDPNKHAPCAHLVKKFSVGSLTDKKTVYEWGKKLDIITIEIENVNTEALKILEEEGVKIYPQPHLIALIQDKRTQKTFYESNNIPTSDFIFTKNKEEIKTYSQNLPLVHKLAKTGYDGKGVQIIKDETDIVNGFDEPGVLEHFVDFKKELSVIVARNVSGETACYPVVELVFHPKHNLVEYLFAPAQISEEIAEKAKKLALKVIDTLGMVGLLAVEMFLTKDDELLVNEIAPRTHNSGHHTIEASSTSQFEQHLRSILNLPLGDTKLHTLSAMINLLGEEGYEGKVRYEGLKESLKIPGVHIHLYGKKQTKPARKMGHITVINQDIKLLKEIVMKLKNTIKIKT